ncbi:guanitoxin biosynthesis L-enduracididine beta-hydroxylase GntD [Nonomuraea angiospora]|uniref:guanitoxin biosynthesis L-enduracididine beta-hydroxylase GntD n=1 Tax=Nonomuraea angiospora TaxID=46172 RepID=UPI00344F9F24
MTPAEARQVDTLARKAAAEYPSAEDPGFVTDVGVIAHDLPAGLRQAVNRARLDERTHVILIRGNPVDEAALDATPRHWRDATCEEARVAGMLLMIEAALLGDAIGWTTQQDGRIITDVLPITGMENSLVSSSSQKELTWHTEDAFSPYRADYVGLYCLRSWDHTPTTVSYADPATLPEDVVRVLMEPRFLFSPDDSHTMPAGTPDGGMVRAAVLDGPIDAPVLRIDRDFTKVAPGDTEAAQALTHVVDHLDGNLYDVALARGDIAFIDNRNVVHGRRAFTPRYDGRDRWLKRVNVAVDLRRTRPGRLAADERAIG